MKDINKEIEKTMQSWDNVERFEASPFLYTRIEQQIKNAETPPQSVSWRWLWQPALIVVLIALNFFTIATAFSSNDSQSDSVYEAIADRYNLSTESETYIIKLN